MLWSCEGLWIYGFISRGHRAAKNSKKIMAIKSFLTIELTIIIVLRMLLMIVLIEIIVFPNDQHQTSMMFLTLSVPVTHKHIQKNARSHSLLLSRLFFSYFSFFFSSFYSIFFQVVTPFITLKNRGYSHEMSAIKAYKLYFLPDFKNAEHFRNVRSFTNSISLSLSFSLSLSAPDIYLLQYTLSIFHSTSFLDHCFRGNYTLSVRQCDDLVSSFLSLYLLLFTSLSLSLYISLSHTVSSLYIFTPFLLLILIFVSQSRRSLSFNNYVHVFKSRLFSTPT